MQQGDKEPVGGKIKAKIRPPFLRTADNGETLKLDSLVHFMYSHDILCCGPEDTVLLRDSLVYMKDNLSDVFIAYNFAYPVRTKTSPLEFFTSYDVENEEAVRLILNIKDSFEMAEFGHLIFYS